MTAARGNCAAGRRKSPRMSGTSLKDTVWVSRLVGTWMSSSSPAANSAVMTKNPQKCTGWRARSDATSGNVAAKEAASATVSQPTRAGPRSLPTCSRAPGSVTCIPRSWLLPDRIGTAEQGM